LVAAAKFLVAATKILFVVPNFVAVTKPFLPCWHNALSQFWRLYSPTLCSTPIIPFVNIRLQHRNEHFGVKIDQANKLGFALGLASLKLYSGVARHSSGSSLGSSLLAPISDITLGDLKLR